VCVCGNEELHRVNSSQVLTRGEVESVAGMEVGVPWLMMCGICHGFCTLFTVGNQCVAAT